MYKIFIDAGHNYSGVDTGATGNGLLEQNITYYIASEVEKILRAKGVTVKMSRNRLEENVGGNSVSESLRSRYTMANLWGADAFVSIHCNAGGGTGCEVYCYKLGGDAERLARTVLNGMVINSGLSSRGVKTANYAVLRNTNMPAILAETAFIDNSEDAKVLGSENGRIRIAKGIAEGVMEYLGIEYSETADRLITPNDIVWELAQRGFVDDKDGMIAEMEENPNGRLYWLARKIVNSI